MKMGIFYEYGILLRQHASCLRYYKKYKRKAGDAHGANYSTQPNTGSKRQNASLESLKRHISRLYCGGTLPQAS